MSIDMLRAFFGWCTLLNWGVMLLALILMNVFRGWAYRLHARMFGVTEEDVRRSIYLLMIQYKTAIILFCLVPYLVLRIMA